MTTFGLEGIGIRRDALIQPVKTSSSIAGGVAEGALPTLGVESTSSAITQNAPPSGYSFLAGQISIDMHYELYQSYSSTTIRETADGYMKLRQSVERSVTADYSFDFSFLAKLDSASQKMAALSPEVLGEFVNAASDLMSLSEEDLQEFIEATDALFNELKEAIGGHENILDSVKDMLQNSMTGFIRSVREAAAGTMEEGEQIQEMQSIDYGGLKTDAARQFDDALFDYLEKLLSESSEIIREQQSLLLEQLEAIQSRFLEGSLN